MFKHVWVAVSRDCLFEMSGFETTAKVFGTEKEYVSFLKENKDFMPATHSEKVG